MTLRSSQQALNIRSSVLVIALEKDKCHGNVTGLGMLSCWTKQIVKEDQVFHGYFILELLNYKIKFTKNQWVERGFTCLSVTHSNHYTVLVWGCSWILFIHGWFCPVRLIRWKTLDFCLICSNTKQTVSTQTTELEIYPLWSRFKD